MIFYKKVLAKLYSMVLVNNVSKKVNCDTVNRSTYIFTCTHDVSTVTTQDTMNMLYIIIIVSIKCPKGKTR